MTVKTFDNNSKFAKETEIVFTSSVQSAVELYKSLGLEVKSYQESLREKWIYKDCSEIVIDTLPGIPTYVEIECDSEEIVRRVSKKLGFDIDKDGQYGSYDKQYLKYYGIQQDDFNEKVSRLGFETVDTDLAPFVTDKRHLLKMKEKHLSRFTLAKSRTLHLVSGSKN